MAIEVMLGARETVVAVRRTACTKLTDVLVAKSEVPEYSATTVLLPTGSASAEQVATPVATGRAAQPAMAAPSLSNRTVPAEGAIVAGSVGEIVAVRTTGWPHVVVVSSVANAVVVVAALTAWSMLGEVLGL
jgi:hypothetical protein